MAETRSDYGGYVQILCVVGARPNFMKIKPVIDALDSRGIESVLVHTGQHYDVEMNEVFFTELGIRPPDHYLGVGSGTHAETTGRVMVAFEPLVDEVRPDVVLVVGDVDSTMACALVAAKSGFRLAHVEAGLRSRDWSMPEEINRIVTDRVSDTLFASAPDAVENLIAEGSGRDQIYLVGNVMIDTLLANLGRARARSIVDELRLERKNYGVLTLHRPSNVDDPTTLTTIVETLGKVSAECPLVFPVHPRTRRLLSKMAMPAGLHLSDPLGYLDFVALEDSAAVVFTDSGGVQEETTVLGVPCVTLRENTERPITIVEGTNVVVGRDPDRILLAARGALAGEVAMRRPALWDGQAGERIADVLSSLDLTEPRPGGSLYWKREEAAQ